MYTSLYKNSIANMCVIEYTNTYEIRNLKLKRKLVFIMSELKRALTAAQTKSLRTQNLKGFDEFYFTEVKKDDANYLVIFDEPLKNIMEVQPLIFSDDGKSYIDAVPLENFDAFYELV
jgi:hypothetical protein